MTETPGAKLLPSTVQTTLDQLEFRRVQRPSWTAFHFPAIDPRGRAEYADVVDMTPREADSVRHLLVDQIRYGRKRVAQARARTVNLLGEEEDADDGNNEWAIRVRQLEEALADVCRVFGLPSAI